MNLLLILVVLFAALFAVVTFLDGRAKPLSAEQQQKLSRWVVIAVFVSLILALLKQFF